MGVSEVKNGSIYTRVCGFKLWLCPRTRRDRDSFSHGTVM